MLSVRQFSLNEIKEATNNFENVLGRGGEGTVYLGQISEFGKVAVKRLKSNLIDFKEEMKIVSNIKHPHLISLRGYCEESSEKILVYEYMENGSLSSFVKKKSVGTICLSWQQRLNICLGAARGLQHLHTETEEFPKGIIHRDIKPDNILIDNNWVAKLSDFGMCKPSHASRESSTMLTSLKGTSGYYAPEYVKYSSITRKIDVHAFGVVMFEVLCRKMPWDRGDESYYRWEGEDLGLWARENVDPEIIEEISEDCLEAFTHIIRMSLQLDPYKRPTINDVVTDLECALKLQELQNKRIHPKAPTSGRKVSIPGSAQEMIQNIKEITGNNEHEDDEIYAMLKGCSMDPIQIMKLLKKEKETKRHAREIVSATAEEAARSISQVKKAAATKIQTLFRSYLARKSLLALRGLVKLQALGRGHHVRKQARVTLQHMQTLVTVQARVCAQRIAKKTEGKLVHLDGDKVFTSGDLLCATAKIVWKNTNGTVQKKDTLSPNTTSITENEIIEHAMEIVDATAEEAAGSISQVKKAAATKFLSFFCYLVVGKNTNGTVQDTLSPTTASITENEVKKHAATKIQSFFRCYLARKALLGLRGLVKLQALVRGHLVRKKTRAILRRMQTLVSIQARALAQRIGTSEEMNPYNHRQMIESNSTQDNRYRNIHQYFLSIAMERQEHKQRRCIRSTLRSSRTFLHKLIRGIYVNT